MQRIHLTVGDVARVKIAATAGPVAETVFATDLMERGGGQQFAPWREAVRTRLAGHVWDLGKILRFARPDADPAYDVRRLLFLIKNGADLMRHPRDPLALPMRMAYRCGVAPHWGRMRRYLEVERERLGRILVGGGIEGLFGTLHPTVNWESPVLAVRHQRPQEVRLNGNGLVVVPSIFLDRPIVLADGSRPDAAPMLICPSTPDPATAESLWNGPAGHHRALVALVGRTRAGVLQTLMEACNTSELGRRLGISPAAASQHATVLRDAGLVTSRRKLNNMLHSLTPLGSALVTGHEAISPGEGLRIPEGQSAGAP